MNPEKVLPPGVNGKITGHLMVKVDEVFWTRNSPGEIFVQLQWWGEKHCTFFRPEDITLNEPKKSNDTSITYSIKTSPGLFESYLRNCSRITFTVLRGESKNVVLGSAVVKDVDKILSLKNYHSYFSIFSPKGNRIGDLHICFELNFSHIGARLTTKQSEEIVQDKSQSYLKNSRLNELYPSISQCKASISHDDNVLSNILQRGQELRKAMVMSVLADCPIDNLESVINFNPNSNLMKQLPKKEDAKLVDFLLGKHMSAEEEKKALEILRCMSPAENLVEIAELNVEKPSDRKIKCCLHGQECGQRSEDFAQKEPLSIPISLASHSPVSPHDSETKKKKQIDEDDAMRSKEKYTKLNLNCYRITISTFKLSPDGCRKICYTPGHNHNPPGTYFILEINPPSKSGITFSKNIKFITKNFKGRSVNFNQGSTHRLCGNVTWSRVCSLLIGTTLTIYWRHLNQRVPCPLGTAKLEEVSLQSDTNSLLLSLPVYSHTRLLTGHLDVTISLGIIDNPGEKAKFFIEEKNYENKEAEDIPSSAASVNVSDIPPKTSFKSASPSASGSDVNLPVPSLDEELIRTIDLLNSKPDQSNIQKKGSFIEKHEACVQTTLPLTVPDCATCNSQKIVEKDFLIRPQPDSTGNLGEDKAKTSKIPQSYPTQDKFTEIQKNFSDFINDPYKNPVPDHDLGNGYSRVPHLPVEFDTETVHEFTMKIDKVAAIPLFTGDNDLDCYVDYGFPKVDHTGQMYFDEITNGTDVRIALRETEFGTVRHHRLRLKSKLTSALLSLPTHEIKFSIWGRYYRPTPRDYKLGKASIPLKKLSTLELVYCQQIKREPIFEKITIPISVVESSMTSGFKGFFGELHVVIGYSCTSGTSYREWRLESQNNNYFCNQQMAVKSKNIESFYNHKESEHLLGSEFKRFQDRDIRSAIIPDRTIPESSISINSKITSRNVRLDTPEFVQSNFNRKNYQLNHDEELNKKLNYHSEHVKSRTHQNMEYGNNSILSHKKNLSSENHDGNKNIKESYARKANAKDDIVQEVIWDMKERQGNKSKNLKNPVNTITSINRQTKPDTGACGDPFESFDLRIDLPNKEESIDFEARSQYSFLCSPPPVMPLIPNQSRNIILESDSSCSIKDRIQKGNPVNPFSSMSNMSFSINSDSSMFKIEPEHYKHKKKSKSKRHTAVSVNNYDNTKKIVRHEESDSAGENFNISGDNVGDNNVSSDATLKSVESLKSFREELHGRESKDIGVETEFITQHKDTQTSNVVSHKEEKYFKTRIQICRALGLPSVEVRQPNGKITMMKPTSCAYFTARLDGTLKTLKTEVVEKKANPIWNASWNVELPVDLLKKSDRELEIFVELSGGLEEPARISDCSCQWPIVLRTSVDLTSITAGLEHASGWFSLTDRALLSRGQLKVIVTPLENTNHYREEWIREYTKSKGKKLYFMNLPSGSSVATSLQDKLKELENLTECMRDKMENRGNWNRSPPLNLLSEVQAIELSQNGLRIERLPETVYKIETATSPILIDSSDSTRLNPVINLKDDEGEEKSVVQTYIVDHLSESSQHDSLETPSETIDRILTKMRTKR